MAQFSSITEGNSAETMVVKAFVVSNLTIPVMKSDLDLPYSA